MIGIYKIENKINGKIYIGQSIDINNRLRHHKTALKGNYHPNRHLQYSFNKYGEDNFIFEIIDICEIDELDALERLYINKYECKHNEWGYNLEDGGHKYKKLSEETKQKHKDYWNSEEGQKQKYKLTKLNNEYWNSEEGEKQKEKLSNERTKKINAENILNCIDKYMTITETAKELNTDRTKITKELRRQRYDRYEYLRNQAISEDLIESRMTINEFATKHNIKENDIKKALTKTGKKYLIKKL